MAPCDELDEDLVVLQRTLVSRIEHLGTVRLARRHRCQDGTHETGLAGPGRPLQDQYGFTRREVALNECRHRLHQSRISLVVWCWIGHLVEGRTRETHIAGRKVPVDGEHFATHQLLANDAEQRSSNCVQSVQACGPNLESAGAVIDLAPTVGAYKDAWSIQQERGTIQSLCDEIGVQREIVEERLQRTSNGASNSALNGIACGASIE